MAATAIEMCCRRTSFLTSSHSGGDRRGARLHVGLIQGHAASQPSRPGDGGLMAVGRFQRHEGTPAGPGAEQAQRRSARRRAPGCEAVSRPAAIDPPSRTHARTAPSEANCRLPATPRAKTPPASGLRQSMVNHGAMLTAASTDNPPTRRPRSKYGPPGPIVTVDERERAQHRHHRQQLGDEETPPVHRQRQQRRQRAVRVLVTDRHRGERHRAEKVREPCRGTRAAAGRRRPRSGRRPPCRPTPATVRALPCAPVGSKAGRVTPSLRAVAAW